MSGAYGGAAATAPPAGISERVVRTYYGNENRWVCDHCGEDFTPGAKGAEAHLANVRSKRFMATIADRMRQTGPLNAVTINKAADEAGVSRSTLGKRRGEYIEAGVLVHDDLTGLALAHELPATLGHWYRRHDQEPIGDETAVTVMQELRNGDGPSIGPIDATPPTSRPVREMATRIGLDVVTDAINPRRSDHEAICPGCAEWLQAWNPVIVDPAVFGANGSYEMAGAVVVPVKCGPDPLPWDGPDDAERNAEEWWGEDPDEGWMTRRGGHWFLLAFVPHKGATDWGLIEVTPSCFRAFAETPDDRRALAELLADSAWMVQRRRLLSDG
jgi:hypothetical protein